MKECDWQHVRYFICCLVFPFTVFLYMVIKSWATLATYSSKLILLHCYSQVAPILCQFQINLLNSLSDLPSLNRNEKVTCENCDTQITKLYLARHKKGCSAGTLFCSEGPNFFTNTQKDLKYHIAKKHSKATASFIGECKICDKIIHSFYYLRKHKRKEHGAQRGSFAQTVVIQLLGDVDDEILKE